MRQPPLNSSVRCLPLIPKTLRHVASLFALLLATSLGAGCAGSTGTKSKVTHIHVTCRVYVDEHGVAKKAEILNMEPATSMTEQAKRDLISVAVLGKTFTPNQEGGKPVAGYLTVPLELDFDLPIPLNGT